MEMHSRILTTWATRNTKSKDCNGLKKISVSFLLGRSPARNWKNGWKARHYFKSGVAWRIGPISPANDVSLNHACVEASLNWEQYFSYEMHLKQTVKNTAISNFSTSLWLKTDQCIMHELCLSHLPLFSKVVAHVANKFHYFFLFFPGEYFLPVDSRTVMHMNYEIKWKG